jgi:hypothetical protein
LREVEPSGTNRRWLCACSCGKEFVSFQNGLRDGNTKSCGCLQKEEASRANKVHGFCEHKLYSVRKAMIRRCYNEKEKQFKNYGARGIYVCEEWRRSPTDFINWCTSNGWKEGLEIDRIDNNDGYHPGNVRFVDRSTNASNTRRNIYVIVDGVKMTVTQAARKNGITPKAAHSRLARGYTPDQAVCNRSR